MRIALCLLFAVFAGCLDAPQALDQDAYDLQVSGVPTYAAAGAPFTFQLAVDGDTEAQSDHIGGHYWAQSTPDPDADFANQAGGCQHLPDVSDLPGTFDVTCTVQSAGTLHLRGHVRITEEDETLNFWSDEFGIEVVDIDMRIENATTAATVGQRFTFDLHIEGDEAFSDHIGAHYWTERTDDPTGDFAAQAGGCEHQAGQVPAVLSVACTWNEEGTFHVYGHLRLASDRPLNLWTAPLTVQVS